MNKRISRRPKPSFAEVSETHGKEKFFTREISGSVTKRLKRIRSSRIFKLARAIYNLVSHISTRIYGVALLCFGIVSTLMYFLNLSYDNSMTTPIVGLLLAGLSIPLLLVDKPIPIFMQEFKPTNYLFFEFFCMKRHLASEEEKSFPVILAMLIGIIPAALSYLLPLWLIALVIGILICIYIGMQSPEFIFLTSLVCLPFIRMLPHSEIVFAAAIIVGAISFIRKVVYGQRTFFVEQYDIIIGIMLIFILISGIFVKGEESFFGSIKMIVFALGYMLAGNIIANRRLAELSVSSVILSGAIASVVSIIQFVIVISKVGRAVGVEELSSIVARLDGVAALLMVAIILAFGMAKDTSGALRAASAGAGLLCILALLLSGEFFALTSLILGGLAYSVIKSNRLPALVLPILLAVSVLMLLLPNQALDVIFKYSPSVVSAEVLFDLWAKSAALIRKNLLIGIGIGSDSFIQEMAQMGISGFNDSSNLFIELGLESGILTPIILLLLLTTRVRHRAMQHLYIRNSQMERISNLSGACLFSLVAFGMVNYIWSDPSIYYLFWCIFGIGSASLRVAKRDYDDRVIYYHESSAHDSAVIDIEIG